MSRRADLLRLLAVVAAFGVSFVLFRRAMPFSLASPWFVFIVMHCFLGLAAVARPILPLAMPRSLRSIRAWEVEGSLYRTLGVPAFGTLLRRTPLRFLNTDVYLRSRSEDGTRLGVQLEAAEAAHLWAAALITPYIAYAAARQLWGTVFCFIVVQVLGNAYPIMHLRAVRYRLDQLALRKTASRVRYA
jgi:hypothetical protein